MYYFERWLSNADYLSKIIGSHIRKGWLSISDSLALNRRNTHEYLIACNEIKNGPMSADNAKLFSSLLAQKNTERDKTGVYTDNLKIYSTYERTVAIMAAGDTWTAVVGVVKTPKGSTVPEVYQRSPELTSVEKNQINTDFAWRNWGIYSQKG